MTMGTGLIQSGVPANGWRSRIGDMKTAHAQVLGGGKRAGQEYIVRQLPQLITAQESVLTLVQIQLHGTTKFSGLLVLTDQRLRALDEQNDNQVLVNFPLGSFKVLGFQNKALKHGAELRLERQGVAYQFKQMVPVSEAKRVAFLLGAGPAPEPDRLRSMPSASPDPLHPLVGGTIDVKLYPDRLVDHKGNHWPMDDSVRAEVETSGHLTVARGRDMGKKGAGTLAFGPAGLLMAGNAKQRTTDTRKFRFTVQSDRWSIERKIYDFQVADTQALASAIKVAAARWGKPQASGEPQLSVGQRIRRPSEAVDAWFEELTPVAAAFGVEETARMTGDQIGGVRFLGDIAFTANEFEVWVNLFPDSDRARRAEEGLLSRPKMKAAIDQGGTVIQRVDHVVFVGTGRGTALDQDRFKAFAERVSEVSPPGVSAPPAQQADGSTDVLEQLRKLGELRDSGVLTDEEFQAKKAELLKRI